MNKKKCRMRVGSVALITQQMVVVPVPEYGMCYDSEGTSLYPFHRWVPLRRGSPNDGSHSMQESHSRAGNPLLVLG